MGTRLRKTKRPRRTVHSPRREEELRNELRRVSEALRKSEDSLYYAQRLAKPSKWPGTILDTTERKQLEEQFRQSQKMEAIGRLAGGIAHDFNNILTIIRGYTELLGHRFPPTDMTGKDIAEIQKATEQASSLTRQLLAFSRKQVLQPRVLQLNLEIQQMEQMLKRLIGEDIELETQLGEALPPILVDPGQIQQILMNLAGNARDAMPHGGRLSIRTSTVHIDARDRAPSLGGLEGTCVKLNVKDNGSGMPPDVFSHLFEPFFTTKEAGHGTGLGLATVYGIVRQSGGGILVESLPGQGTAFDLYFPASKKSEIPAQGAPPPEAAGGQETILLVEDEAQIREVLKRSLSLKGYTVYEASQGAEALELFKKFGASIDLIITDMIMPQMGGKELTLAIRRERSDTRILFMSGYTDQHTMKNGLLTDRSFFLQKPFNISDLLAKVRDLLENRKQAA